MYLQTVRSLLKCTSLLLLAAMPQADATGQSSPCFQNMVTNGNFELSLPPWSISGNGVLGYENRSVDGVATSRCIRMTGGNWSLVSPDAAPVTLAAAPYELSINLLRSGMNLTLEVGITPTGGARVLLYRANHLNLGTDVRSRIAIPFDSPGPGNYRIDITVGTNYTNTPLWIDDVVLHPARPLFFTVNQDGRRTGAQNSFQVRGSANQVFAVLVAFGSTVPVTFPLCTNDLLIGPLPGVATWVDITNLTPAGTSSSSFGVPPIVAGIPLWWQPIALTPGCEFGCADMIAFQ